MKLVGLISGGKDSCYNLVQCIACGHEIVALAHLTPGDQEELDSFMYQCAGHDAVKLFAEALDLPLYQRVTNGKALCSSSDYKQTQGDEVEDLYELLKTVKNHENVDGVAAGAILSNYQRVRVEHVCGRLGLTSFSYLWQRDQEELLSEMLAAGMHAIIIKVATLGLYPNEHLGKELSEIFPHLIQVNRKYGLNICGEGGEYETFTLDCPLFKKRIVVDEKETVILDAEDAIAPVGYIKLKKLHLEAKPGFECLSQKECIQEIVDFRPDYSLLDLNNDLTSKTTVTVSGAYVSEEELDIKQFQHEATDLEPNFVSSSSGWFWISNLTASDKEPHALMKGTLKQLQDTLSRKGLSTSDLVSVQLYISNMQEFVAFNNAYKLFFDFNPPSRVCVQVLLPKNIRLILHCIGVKHHGLDLIDKPKVNHMHIQSVSYWAPANIGPYSQAVKVGDFMYVAGQIALVPGTMLMVGGGIVPQCLLSLRHVQRVLKAMDSNCDLKNVVICVCYVTHRRYVVIASEEWQKAVKLTTETAPVFSCVIVPGLPRDALIEWQIVTHTRHPKEWQWKELNQKTVDEVCVNTHLGMINTESYCSGMIICKCDGIGLTELTLYKIFLHLISTVHNYCTEVSIHMQVYYIISKIEPSHIQNAWHQLNHDKCGFSLIPVLGHNDDSCSLIIYLRFG